MEGILEALHFLGRKIFYPPRDKNKFYINKRSFLLLYTWPKRDMVENQYLQT